MIFRTSDRRAAARSEDNVARDVLLAAADARFGRQPEALGDDHIVIDGTVYIYDPVGDPTFVVQPECDRCGASSIDQFPLEEWNVSGVRVRGQARTTCRDCRFALAIAPDEPRVRTAATPTAGGTEATSPPG